jgi:hypothetical protein
MRKRFYTPLHQSSLGAWEACCDGDSAPAPVIHNIVSTAQIDSTRMPMDLQAISEVLPGSSYDRRKFAAMTIRLANPSCTLLLFSSGKLVVTGGKNWYEGVLSCLRIARFLQRSLVGVDFWLKSCNVQAKKYLNMCVVFKRKVMGLEGLIITVTICMGGCFLIHSIMIYELELHVKALEKKNKTN